MATYLQIGFISFLVYTLTICQNSAVDYCQYPCGSNNHTVCVRKPVNCGAGTSCGANYTPIALTDADRIFMLDLHNFLRNKVAVGNETLGGGQPPASNMNALSYCKELEMIAQCHTNNCQFVHDKCRRTVAYSWVGQNLGIRGYSGSTGNYKTVMNSTIYAWYLEVKNFNPAWVTTFTSYNTTNAVGHYTQCIWAKTTQVGCGMTRYVDSSGWVDYLMACNYATGGNVVGQSVYTLGIPASACGSLGVNANYSGLCGNDTMLS